MEISSILESGILIFGLTEVIKRLLPKPWWKKIAPLTAVIIGSILHVYYYGYSPENVIYGAILGLSATGIYKIASNDPCDTKVIGGEKKSKSL